MWFAKSEWCGTTNDSLHAGAQGCWLAVAQVVAAKTKFGGPAFLQHLEPNLTLKVEQRQGGAMY
jgi:hypothetical protein